MDPQLTAASFLRKERQEKCRKNKKGHRTGAPFGGLSLKTGSAFAFYSPAGHIEYPYNGANQEVERGCVENGDAAT